MVICKRKIHHLEHGVRPRYLAKYKGIRTYGPYLNLPVDCNWLFLGSVEA